VVAEQNVGEEPCGERHDLNAGRAGELEGELRRGTCKIGVEGAGEELDRYGSGA
jgi:hypothetical protein